MNKRTDWYRIRIICEHRHRGDMPRGETRIVESIRKRRGFYAKVEIAVGISCLATSYRFLRPGAALVAWREGETDKDE
jgi:hypothetical protein